MNANSQKGFTLIEIMIVVVIISLLALMAIPAFKKVGAANEKKAITDNLSELAEGARNYFLNDPYAEEVDFSTLTAPGSYVEEFTHVGSDEKYTQIIRRDTKFITARLPDGTVIQYKCDLIVE